MASPLGIALAQANQQMAPYRPGTVAPTNVGDIVAQSSDAAYKTYAAQLQQQNAMFGGLAGLGSAGVLAMGPKLSGYLFGSAAPAAATGAAGAAGPTALGTASSYLAAPSAIGGLADAGTAAAAPAADAAFSAGTGAVPFLAAGGTDALGSVAAADAAATAAAAPAVADAGAAGAFSLADLLPILFA